jgi:A/G-specific adenine glycosylase
MMDLRRDSHDLTQWYVRVRRELPWRENRDPYRIWISEVMLQQTTVAAVVPFYQRFMTRFPTLRSLASSSIDDVVGLWAGLGYYSRARNLHKSAQQLAERKGGFPQTFADLLKYPGFGPYTARAVASLAFNEKTGVLDGNVIRILSRKYGLALQWWKPNGRDELQRLADQLAQVEAPADLNQGMMELGATICTPQKPACLLCPWSASCHARLEDKIALLPLKKPRRARELWQWRPTVVERHDSVFLVPNDYAPFLKGHFILPGSVQRLDDQPKKYHYRGSVTHHDIFVSVTREPQPTTIEKLAQKYPLGKWVAAKDLAREIPSTLIRKAIHLDTGA